MNRDDRVAFFESVLDTFLTKAKDRGYIILEITGCKDEYVQMILDEGRLVGEVGSRQWQEPERPLPAGAVEGLALLGFTGGGAERNFARQDLPKSAPELAALVDRLLLTAYTPGEDYAPLLGELNLNDVTLPRAERFTRAMIEAHLHQRTKHILRDDDGDFRADIACDGSTEPVTLWFIATGDDDTFYSVHSDAHHRPGPATRDEALARCNDWNREHRAPTAVVIDDADGSWRIVTKADIDLTPGVTRPLFALFTDHVVEGILEFWRWLAMPSVDAPTPPLSEEQR